MTEVWEIAARDLGFEFKTPYVLQQGSKKFEYLGLVFGFGRPKGTLILIGFDNRESCRLASENGFAWSCLPENGDAYDREVFIDVLNDWGWAGGAESAPAWYSGRPWA